MGRIGKYETHVQPHLEEITKWLSEGMSEEDIATDMLHISISTFTNYKRTHEELRQAIARATPKLVKKVKAALLKRALGFRETDKETVVEVENGRKKLKEKEIDKYYPPDVGAIHLWLKNHDETWTNDDKETMSLKRAKLELEKLKAEAENW